MIKKIILDNGLTVLLNRDKSKARTTANIYVKCGGVDNTYKVDGIKKVFPYGVAHFLEHYLLEQSIYGNAGSYFSKDYIDFNGITYNYKTEYYISTVHDFKENFVKLINIVNNPIFNDDNVSSVRKPIIAEINRKNDYKSLKYYETIFKSVFEREVFNKTLGSISDIQNMDAETLRLFHKINYRPLNEIIAITGNFDLDIIDLIENEFKKLNFYDKEVITVRNKEKNEVVNKMCDFYGEEKNESVTVSYKINIENYKPKERNKIDYYFSYLLDYNFGEKSSLFTKLLKDKFTVFGINTMFNVDMVENFLMLSITIYTTKYDEAIKIITSTMKNLSISEKSFNDGKRNNLINMINNLERKEYITDNYINNYFLYNLEANDDLKFVKSLNILECKSILESLDLSNYSVVVNKGCSDLERVI